MSAARHATAHLLTMMLLLILTACTSPGSAPTTASAAEVRYTQTCAVCHDQGVQGAPVPGVVEDWGFRLENSREDLYTNTILGVGEMPPRGACPDCTDAELRTIVDYMLRNVPAD